MDMCRGCEEKMRVISSERVGAMTMSCLLPIVCSRNREAEGAFVIVCRAESLVMSVPVGRWLQKYKTRREVRR